MPKRVTMIVLVFVSAFVGLVGVLWGLNGRIHTNTVLAAPQQQPPIAGIFTPTWTVRTVDSGGNNVSLALNSQGQPAMGYFRTGNLQYAHWLSQLSTWDIQEVVGDTEFTFFTSLVFDNSDQPHISYYEVANGDLKYATWNGSNWVTQTVDTSGTVGWYLSLALDSNDWPHISYFDDSNGDLKYAYWNGADWVIEIVDSAGGVGLYTSLVVDDNDWSHVSYYDATNGNLKYARRDGISWMAEVVDSGGDVGEYSSLAVDSNFRAHISYYDATNQDLKYASWNGLSWVTEVVDANGDVGRATSLVLDALDAAHISYFDATNDHLMYTTFDDGLWMDEVVDAGIMTGLNTSLALDGAGRPHIGYYDSVNENLKYAHVGFQKVITSGGGGMVVPGAALFDVPTGGFTNTVVLSYTAVQPVAGDLLDVGVFWAITAVYTITNQPASLVPGQTISSVITYDEANIPARVCENRLALFGWIPKRLHAAPAGSGGSWVPIVPSTVNVTNNTITAELDRLGVYAIFGDCPHYLSLPIVRN